ncbi:MAG: type I glutamate--ammonia ligase [Cyanobacteria bacterium NC_groundwater_1444_Ag_S-0.65um_54_12]|nr:type I glutamate--ammonia ligase [Cyanobacteria bacterium NC_groundwater_1444_Ag_S-0.65um_54_12]
MSEKTVASAYEVLKKAESEDVRFVNLQFTDILGVVKSVTIPISQFSDCIEHGKWFDGSSIEGFVRIAESDMYLLPDLSTFRVIPWEQGEGHTLARVICWVYTPDGEKFAGDPRGALDRVLQEARSLGYDFNTGPELEFFLFRITNGNGRLEPLPHDMAGYFDLTTDQASEIRKDMVNALEAMGIRVETSHHEVAVGQHEIDFQYDNALRTADNAVTFRYTLKAIAQRHGLHCTFMPKPIFGVNGSGMHTHMSLFKDGSNAMFDDNDPYGLSGAARHFIAGILQHARGMCAVLAPTVNSYKRLVPGYEAPVYLSWARQNRSALVRVPRISRGQPNATRIELRCPDPSCNPYLAFAVMLQAGLDGIKNELAPPEPVEENIYHMEESERQRRNLNSLPGSLGEALSEMKADPLVREALGDHIFERFIDAKLQEWDEFRMQVTPWEIERYLPIF